MVSTYEKWVRIFDIPEISEHKRGFTIYKIVSLLYKESCPDAVTKVTVWKRFNEFKKLHHDLKAQHKKLNIKTKFPNLPSKTLFKRFDAETIQERKQSILNFLDFIASNQQLFTSPVLVKFLETSHIPKDKLNSNINLIRADLKLPEETDLCVDLNNSDEEKTISDTDSFTSSLALSFQNDIIGETKLKKLNSSTSINSQSSSTKLSDSVSIATALDNITLLDGQIYTTPPDTPGYSNTDDQVMQYIIDASVHINMAVELENDKQYEEAFSAYKTAIDILLKYGKDDPNYDRRQMVRYKTEKYLIKAEKIYNMYLDPAIKNLHLLEEEEEKPVTPKGPLFDLYKFKVVKVIANGMLVLHSELQQLFYIKVIHKTVQFLNENLILPENVPYMIKLHNHYNCENALFLVLEYCSGTKLSDHLKTQSLHSDEMSTKPEDRVFQHLQGVSDNESEKSFSELINEYSRSKNLLDTKVYSGSSNRDQVNISDDDSFEKVDFDDLLPANKRTVNILDKPLEPCTAEDLLSMSKKANYNVSQTENDIVKQKYTKKKVKEIDKSRSQESRDRFKLERSISQVSSIDMEEFDGVLVLPEETVTKWAVQLLIALEKLHTLGVICRDLQSKNILIDENSDLVLTYMCNVKEFGDIFCDGINYSLAPEVYSFQEITPAVDWWSYGAILYEMLVGVPLAEVHPNGVSNFAHLKVPRYVSAAGRSILKQLLNCDPNERLGSGPNGTENIKSHPFFHSFNWDSFNTFQ